MPALARFLIINAYAALSLVLLFVLAVFAMAMSWPALALMMAGYLLASVVAWSAYVRTYPPGTVTLAHLFTFSAASGAVMLVQGGLWLWAGPRLISST